MTIREMARSTSQRTTDNQQLKCTSCDFMPLKFSELKAVEQRTYFYPHIMEPLAGF